MTKEFSNIIVFNNEDIQFIKEKIQKMIIDLDYSISNEKEHNIVLDILHDKINNISIISSSTGFFNNSDSNKSMIRKLSKKLASDTFLVSSNAQISIIEKYSFNKRLYDYICFGDKEELKKLGFDIEKEKYIYDEAWKNHFVGRNNISNLDKIIQEKNRYFEFYEILIEILKLYGVKEELTTYNVGDRISNHEILKETIYIK